MADNIALNVLYILTLSDVERGWILATGEQREQLHKLQHAGNKREYLEVAKALPAYGCLKFASATVAYPVPASAGDSIADSQQHHHHHTNGLEQQQQQRLQRPAAVYIGNKELCVRAAGAHEMRFKVTLMRCWRVTTNYTDTAATTDDFSPAPPASSPVQTSMELSFEYLMAKKRLQWVTIVSEQAMLMSVCLQSMVEELLSRKDVVGQHQVDLVRAEPLLLYVRRDGHSRRMSESSSTDTISSLVGARLGLVKKGFCSCLCSLFSRRQRTLATCPSPMASRCAGNCARKSPPPCCSSTARARCTTRRSRALATMICEGVSESDLFIFLLPIMY